MQSAMRAIEKRLVVAAVERDDFFILSHPEVRAIVEQRYDEAWQRGDLDGILACLHPAAVLVFVHWALTAFDPITAYIHIGILAAIEIARFALKR